MSCRTVTENKYLAGVNPVLKHKAPMVTLLGIAAAIAAVVLLSVDSEGRPGAAQASDGNVNVAVGSLFFGTTGSATWNGTGDPGTFEETTIHVGDSITWTPWSDTHTVTGCDPNTFWVSCNGDAPIGNSGSQGSAFSWGPRTFNTAGEYPYLCTLHPGFMRGKIVVQAAPTPASVGGIGGVAEGAVSEVDSAALPADGSGGPPYALIAGALAAAVIIAAGAWYARRRWLE